MHRREVIVLKFGGSVLTDRSTVEQAVHEIHRWRRDGLAVIAVVSAFAGRTDALLRECTSLGHRSPAAIARHLGLGERESAEVLVERLDAAGIVSRLISPRELRLIANGDPLDADPASLDVEPLHRSIALDETVVVPGFVAIDARGDDVLLGRGGSDLTALVLADGLRCRCRLVKDVDGLYESDPAGRNGSRPRRYAVADYEAALATDGSIIQHKATRLARARGTSFELGATGEVDATRIGAARSRWSEPLEPRSQLTVALLGCGTVGAAVLAQLEDLRDRITVIAIGVRDPSQIRSTAWGPELAQGVLAAATCGADVVIEAIGGIEPALSLLRSALASGSHVVTANKAVIAEHGEELEAAARAAGRRLCCSAAVGGTTPILEVLRSRAGRRVRRIRGVLNATANVVLDGIDRGVPLETALDAARRRGLAERDASLDLEGLDAAHKLAVMARALGWSAPDVSTIERDRIDAHLEAPRAGRTSTRRQVAVLESGTPDPLARVRIEEVAPADPLHAIADDGNAALIEWEDGETELVRGRGAGGRPTAESVLGDLLDLERGIAREAPTVHSSGCEALHGSAT